MIDLISRLESNAVQLRAALAAANETQVDRIVQSFDGLLEDASYRFVGNERLLAEINLLLTLAIGGVATDELAGLRQHLGILTDIHNKLYQVLAPEVDLETLLMRDLQTWTILDTPMECVFPDSLKANLHTARTTGESEQKLRSFFAAYCSFLREQGFADAVSSLEPAIIQAIEGYSSLRRWQTYGLFVSGNQGVVYGVKVSILSNGEGKIQAANPVGPAMETEARRVLNYIHQRHPQTRKWDFRWEIGRDDIEFDGSSVGLALCMAILTNVTRLEIDAYTAFTGRIDWDTGAVRRIEQLESKLNAARVLGIRRVFVPRENEADYKPIDGLQVSFVDSVADVEQQLQNKLYYPANTDLRGLAETKIQELEIELRAKQIRKVKQERQSDTCIRVEFSDGRENTIVLVHHAHQLKPVVQGKITLLAQHVEAECSKVFGQKTKPGTGAVPDKPETRKYKVQERGLQQRLEQHLLSRGDTIRETEPNCQYRAKVSKGGQVVFVRQFTSGTLTVAGVSPLLDEIDSDVKAFIGAADLQILPNSGNQLRTEAQVAAVEAVELGDRWIGTDEAGKGDYFGPLVGAAVLVDAQIALKLSELGVKDSKTLTDKRNQELAESIRRICGKRAQVVSIPPEKYNALYDAFQREGKNLNTLLAWAHTRALEDILSEFPQQQITVIVDKFGDDRFVQSKLLSKGRQTNLNLVQLPKAEANIAVAAASVLARAQFLQALKRMSEQYGIEFPKGASDPRIHEIGRRIVASQGKDGLLKIAKVHFVTTKKILDSI